MKIEEIPLAVLGALSSVGEKPLELMPQREIKAGASLTSRERVLAAISHRRVDRIPLMLWLEPHTTLKIARSVKSPEKLSDQLLFEICWRLSKGLPSSELQSAAPLPIYLVQSDYLLDLGADIVDLVYSHPLFWYRQFYIKRGEMRFKDMYGITRGMKGLYLETVDVPCKTKDDLESYRFPDISFPLHYTHIKQYRRKHPEVALLVWCMGMQDWGQNFHTLEKLYLGMIKYPRVVKKFFKRMTEHTLQGIKGALRAGADLIMIGDDYGTQDSMFISKEMWEEFTYPCLKKQIEVVHDWGGKALLHSDGYIMPLLPKFVEAKLDALHPFQPVEKNNLKEAKKLYGDKLTFFTGIDVQRIGRMSRREVRKDIVKTYKVASRQGGMVLSTTNMLQVDTPVGNLKEMFATIRDIKQGKYG